MIESIVPNFKFADNEEIKKDIEKLKGTKETISNKKKEQKSGFGDKNIPSHITITFKTYNEKAEYLESIGINGDTVFITSNKYFESLSN